ncbi:hypothetical protein BCV72DRAFT_228355 [Rhizopus microsporus var. microsporus]|uniref:UBZ4-type domain-containing protein n=1 Tax=Rhizopus microsporus var. microsporus TaxID=86635 RepID=A0A1X0R2W1_RHIZD|nr:hypothetical protein BCV72DRAFT_228355 [Rhizopus microsporus var. microsporus]
MMISTCSHSFCALCVRRCLSEEQVCPKCRKEAFSNSIIHNYDLDNVVNIWRISRNALLSADQLLNKKQQTPHLAESVVSESSSSQTSQSLNMDQLRIRENLPSIATTPIIIDDDQSDDFKPSASLQRISTTSLRRSTRLGSKDAHLSDLSSSQPIPQLPSITPPPIVSPQSATNNSNESLKSTSVVQCPICQQSMKYVVLDRHLDGCTKGDSRIPPSPPLPPSDRSTSAPRPNMQLFSGMTNRKSIHLGRKPGKVVYAIQSDKDMRMILRVKERKREREKKLMLL